MSAHGKPGAQSPHTVAKQVGLRVKGGELSWADLADAAFLAYWEKRSTPLSERVITGPRCNSIRGYEAHRKAKTKPCDGCKRAWALVRKIERKRAAA